MSNNQFTQRKIVLMYREPGKANYEKPDDMFVDLDSASGGYPYRTNMLGAYDFQTIEKATQYNQSSKGVFVVCELVLTGTVKTLIDPTVKKVFLKVNNTEHYANKLNWVSDGAAAISFNGNLETAFDFKSEENARKFIENTGYAFLVVDVKYVEQSV